TLPGGNTSDATAINATGQVVGSAHGIPFLWQDGRMTALGANGYAYGNPVAINDAGQIVGSLAVYFSAPPYSYISAGLWHDGPPNYLGSLGSSNSWATGINGAGQVIGQVDTWIEYLQAYVSVPFLWQNSVTTAVTTETDFDQLQVQAINDVGQIAA